MDEKDNFFDLNKFELLNAIGKGAFSKVFRVKDTSTKEIFAAKILKIEINSDDETVINSEDLLRLLREVKLMASLNHPSILGFVGFSLFSFDQKPNPTIITKYASNGSLRDIIKLELSGLSPPGWDSTRKLINIYGIASGLAYLHQHKIIHRDIKPENILMDDYLFPKIADFGLSKITESVSKSMNMQSQSCVKGTPIYIAPEIFRDNQYTNLGDVYSFSIIVYEIMTGITPFQNLNLNQLMFKAVIQNMRPELTSDIPLSYQNLISECWSPNPNDRPTFDEIINRLKADKGFITDSINEVEYYDYIDFIDNYKVSFNINNSIHFKDIIKRNSTITKVSIQKIVEQDETKIVENPLKKNKIDKKQKKHDEREEKKEKVKIKRKIPKTFEEKIFYATNDLFFDGDEFEEEEDDFDNDDFYEKFEGRYIKHIKVRSENNNNALCKVISPDFLKFNCEELPKIDQKTGQQSIIDDANTSTKINHPFIVKFLDEDENYIASTTFYYEYPKNRSLYYVIQNEIKLTPVQRQIIIIGTALGLYYLHKNNFLLGTLSPQIIWLYDDFYPKIFRVEKIYYEKSFSDLKYQAPEILKDENQKTTKESDVFEFGRLLYYLITGSEPFSFKKDSLKNHNFFTLLSSILDGKIPFIPDFVSDPLRNFLVKCWESDPSERPPLKEIVYNLIFNKEYYIDGIKSEKDFQKINEFITKNDLKFRFNHSLNSNLIVELNDEATIDKKDKKLSLFQELNDKLENIIQLKFTNHSKKRILKLLIKMAKNKLIQNNEEKLQKVIGYVNNLSFKDNELANEFLKIVFGEQVTDFSNPSLVKCKKLNISNDVILIKSHSFDKFSHLLRINIPNSVSEIEYEAFCDCSNLTFINIPESISSKSLGKGAFKNCPKLKCIKTPSKLKEIQDETFKGDENLSHVNLNYGLEIIGKEAFYGCNAIKHLKIPKSIKLIDDKAFYNCKNLKTIIFKGNQPKFGNDAISPDVLIIYDD